MVLLPQPLRLGGMKEQLVYALPDLRVRVREKVGRDAFVSRRPRGTAVIRPKRAAAGKADVHPLRFQRVELDRVAGKAAGTGEPLLTRRVFEKAAVRPPGLAPVVGAEENGGIPTEVKRLGLVRLAGL